MTNDLQKKIVRYIVLAVACSCAYYYGTIQHNCPPTEVFTKEIFNYSVEPGKNGLIRFSVDADSLADVVYVENQDTFSLNGLNRQEFEELMDTLYEWQALPTK